jgi:hypothetical protein
MIILYIYSTCWRTKSYFMSANNHKDDPWVLVDRVAQVFYVLDLETRKYVVVFAKQNIIRVKNVEDNNEDVNQFEEMSLFTSPMNIKHIEKDFKKKHMPYMQKGGNEKFV